MTILRRAQNRGVPALNYGLVGNAQTNFTAEYNAGIRSRMYELDWRQMEPTTAGTYDTAYIAARLSEMNAIRAAGFQIVLEMGYSHAPSWLHASTTNTSYVNQYGDVFSDALAEDANMVFNATLRTTLAGYIAKVFNAFGTNFLAVRIGGGHFGETGYPANSFNAHSNCYWMYDTNALTTNPYPTWKPGDASPSGQASAVVNWYLNALVAFQTSTVAAIRAGGYTGRIFALYPSYGVRPGQLAGAVAVNLNGTTSVEANGELQRGFDYARLVAAIADVNILPYHTGVEIWGGTPAVENGTDQTQWSPPKYLWWLGRRHGLRLPFAGGENAGNNTPTQMTFSIAQLRKYGALHLSWIRKDDFDANTVGLAHLSDYATAIAS